MAQDPREPFEGLDQPIVVRIALRQACDRITHTLLEQIETRSGGIDGLKQIRLAEVLRRGLGERWCLDDEDGRPLMKPHQLKGRGALQPYGRLPLGGASPLDTEADGLLAAVDDDI